GGAPIVPGPAGGGGGGGPDEPQAGQGGRRRAGGVRDRLRRVGPGGPAAADLRPRAGAAAVPRRPADLGGGPEPAGPPGAQGDRAQREAPPLLLLCVTRRRRRRRPPRGWRRRASAPRTEGYSDTSNRDGDRSPGLLYNKQ
ncbi:unnamed protein product, partial [Heterosigma akashiwo]